MKNVLIISALAVGSMYGAVVVIPIPGTGGTWTQFNRPTVVGDFSADGETILNDGKGGAAYWNNNSSDANEGSGSGGVPATIVNPECANIGCMLTGTGAFGTPNNAPKPNYIGSTPAYLNDGAGGKVDFNFAGIADGTQLIAEFAGTPDQNWIGWYDASFFSSAVVAAGAPDTGTFNSTNTAHWGVIFTGPEGAAGPKTFTPTANFGLWALAGNTALTGASTNAQIGDQISSRGLFTNTVLNGTAGVTGCGTSPYQGSNCADPGAQHFAVFATSAVAGASIPVDYWVGFEDLRVNSANGEAGDRDYQDSVFKLRVVPEPGYYVLLSLGLAALGLRRRMNKTSVN